MSFIKQQGQQIVHFILFGNVYIALGAVCITQSSIIQLGLKDHLLPYSSLVFFSTLFVYNFQRIFYSPQKEKSRDSIRRAWILENKKAVTILSIIGIIGAIASFLFTDFKVILYLSPLLLLCIAYFAPLVKLRKNPWLKLFTLALVWTLVTSLIPILLNGTELFTKNNLLHLLVRFFFMIGICIPFDIRDVIIDTADNIKTIANVLGESNAKRLAFGAMFLYICMVLMEYIFGMFNLRIEIALLISAILNTLLVLMSNSKRNEYFYVAGIDGTMILQSVLLFTARFCC